MELQLSELDEFKEFMDYKRMSFLLVRQFRQYQHQQHAWHDQANHVVPDVANPDILVFGDDNVDIVNAFDVDEGIRHEIELQNSYNTAGFIVVNTVLRHHNTINNNGLADADGSPPNNNSVSKEAKVQIDEQVNDILQIKNNLEGFPTRLNASISAVPMTPNDDSHKPQPASCHTHCMKRGSRDENEPPPKHYKKETPIAAGEN